MYARISLALVLGLLLAAAGSGMLRADPATCQQDFDPLRMDLEGKGKSLQEAGKRKATAKELCSRITSYSAAEAKVLRFFESRGAECGVPPSAAEGLRKSRAKTTEMRNKICQAAANPGPAAPPPSAGLSGALGPNTGVVPQQNQSGGGIFDTLSGNVLQR